MDVQVIVTMLNTGRTAEDLAHAEATLKRLTVAQLTEVNRHPDLICHAYGRTKSQMVAYLVGGIASSLRTDVILRCGGTR